MYGQWMLQEYGDEIIREYWNNKMFARDELNAFKGIKSELIGKYRSISFHHWY